MLREEIKWTMKTAQLKQRKHKKMVKEETRNKHNKQQIVTNTADINPAASTITLNVNGLNTAIKRKELSKWIKIRLSYSCLQATHFKYQNSD